MTHESAVLEPLARVQEKGGVGTRNLNKTYRRLNAAIMHSSQLGQEKVSASSELPAENAFTSTRRFPGI
jgi:hypothetical protein